VPGEKDRSSGVKYQFHLWPQTRYKNLEEVARVVTAGESLGYAAVASGEHILVPNGHDADIIGSSYFDPMVLFSYLATKTTAIELQFCALVVPYRHPALAARGIASLDNASNGRLSVVIGSGWSRSEFEALDVPFDQRGAITDEYVDVMRELWTQSKPRYQGKHITFSDTVFEPKCIQRPHVPLWVGGRAKVAARRIASYGVGWIPLTATMESLRSDIDMIRDAVATAGRNPAELEFAYRFTYLERDSYHAGTSTIGGGTGENLVARSPNHALEIVAGYAAAGLTRVQVQMRWDSPNHFMEGLHRFAEEVMVHTGDM
jgi:probable F420-dependent oxidoreductase